MRREERWRLPCRPPRNPLLDGKLTQVEANHPRPDFHVAEGLEGTDTPTRRPSRSQGRPQVRLHHPGLVGVGVGGLGSAAPPPPGGAVSGSRGWDASRG